MLQCAGNFPAHKARVRENIAKYVGTSDRTLEKIVAITEAAKKQPEKLGIDHVTISRVFQNGQLSEMKQPENLQFYNVWNIG